MVKGNSVISSINPEILKEKNNHPRDREFFFNIINTVYPGSITRAVEYSIKQRDI